MTKKTLLTKLMLLLVVLLGGAGAVWADTYVKVTDASTLKAGDKVLFVQSNSKSVATNTISSSYLERGTATFTDGKITGLPDNAGIFTLGGKSGAWTLANDEGKLLGAIAAKKLAWGSGTTTWTISISNGTATIYSTTSSLGRILYNVNNPRFLNYTSATNTSMTLIELFTPEAAEVEEPVDDIAAPTFSVPAGSVAYGTEVTISAATGCTLSYTTDGTDPSESNTAEMTDGNTVSITIVETTTIRAIALGDEANKSKEASATYTIKAANDGLAIDFESDLSNYESWSFSNIVKANAITAHGGSYYGNTDSKETASVTSKDKIAYPGIFTCYLSKESSNTNANSNWKIQVSENGSSWTDVETHAAAVGLTQGNWVEFSANLTSYNNVYVRLLYSGTTAKRAVDDIELTLAVPVEIGAAGMATFSSTEAVDFTEATAIEAYTATVTADGKITFKRVNKVPANTGLLLRNAAGEDKGAVAALNIPVIAAEDAETIGENALVAVSSDIATLATDGEGCKNYILNKVDGNVGFYRANGQKVAAGKAYLEVPAAVAARTFFAISFDEPTGVSTIVSTANENTIVDLQGRRVAQPTKGLYIVNGKKIVVR